MSGWTAADLIADVLERVGGQVADASDVLSARRSLWLVLQEWAAQQANTGRFAQLQLRLPLRPPLTLPREVDDLLDVLLVEGDGRSSHPLERLSRDSYAEIADKLQDNAPSAYWPERSQSPRLHVWPCGGRRSVIIWYVRRPAEFSALHNDLDAPERWWGALTHAVAADLATKRQPPLDERVIARLADRAIRAYELARRNDRERVNFRVRV